MGLQEIFEHHEMNKYVAEKNVNDNKYDPKHEELYDAHMNQLFDKYQKWKDFQKNIEENKKQDGYWNLGFKALNEPVAPQLNEEDIQWLKVLDEASKKDGDGKTLSRKDLNHEEVKKDLVNLYWETTDKETWEKVSEKIKKEINQSASLDYGVVLDWKTEAEKTFLNTIETEKNNLFWMISKNSYNIPSGNARNSIVSQNTVNIVATNGNNLEHYATSDPYEYAKHYIEEQNRLRWLSFDQSKIA